MRNFLQSDGVDPRHATDPRHREVAYVDPPVIPEDMTIEVDLLTVLHNEHMLADECEHVLEMVRADLHRQVRSIQKPVSRLSDEAQQTFEVLRQAVEVQPSNATDIQGRMSHTVNTTANMVAATREFTETAETEHAATPMTPKRHKKLARALRVFHQTLRNCECNVILLEAQTRVN